MRGRLLDTAATVGLFLLVAFPFAALAWLISRLI
jgi:hypothetical protein